jgi:hypothetical protein
VAVVFWQKYEVQGVTVTAHTVQDFIQSLLTNDHANWDNLPSFISRRDGLLDRDEEEKHLLTSEWNPALQNMHQTP